MTNYIDLIDSNGNEWTRTSRFREAKETIAAQAAVIDKLAKRVASTNIILEVVCNIHPESVCARYELAENKNVLAIPTDSTQILEQYVKEKTQAQAAVIDRLREALTACVCAMQDHQAGIGITEIFDKSEALGRKMLAIPTDSTQILAEVRRAERKRCAKVCESHPDPEYTAVHLECARRILEME